MVVDAVDADTLQRVAAAWFRPDDLTALRGLRRLSERLGDWAGVAEGLGLGADELLPYGHHIAKVAQPTAERLGDQPDGRRSCIRDHSHQRQCQR